MSQSTIFNAITDRFYTLVDDADVVGTVQYDNHTVTLPENEITCRVSITPGEGRQVSIGVDQFRQIGILNVELISPLGDGIGTTMSVADSIVSEFRNVTTSTGNVRFKVPSVQNMGREGNTWRVLIRCPYWVDEV